MCRKLMLLVLVLLLSPLALLAQQKGTVPANVLETTRTLEAFLTDDEWYPTKSDDGYTYRYRFKGDNGSYSCFAKIMPEQQYLLCYIIAPANIAEDMRGAVAEYITRANYGLYIGNFEMDYSDGEVRYKVSVDFEGSSLSTLMIKNAVYPTARMMDKYYAGILTMLYGGKSAEDAVYDVEN